MAFQLDLLGSLTWYSLTRSSKTRSSRTWSSQTRIHGLSDDVFVDSVITDLVFTDLAVEGNISLYTPAIEITNPKVSIQPKCIFFLQNLEIGSRDDSNEQKAWMSPSNTRRFNVVRSMRAVVTKYCKSNFRWSRLMLSACLMWWDFIGPTYYGQVNVKSLIAISRLMWSKIWRDHIKRFPCDIICWRFHRWKLICFSFFFL